MYRAKLKRDLDRWSAMGLINEREAQAMLRDHDGQASSFRIGAVLLMLSAVLLSAAILLLVAANWQTIPRLVKIFGVIAFIWGFHCGGAILIALGRQAFGQALLILGAASFGGGLALVGQLYHLSGDQLDLFYVWLAAATLSCVLFRSGGMAGFVATLSVATALIALDQYDFDWTVQTVLLPPGLAVLIVALSFWAGHERVRHIAFLLLFGWLIWLYAHHTDIVVAFGFVAGGFGVFVAVALSRLYQVQILRLAASYGLALAVAGLALVHLEYDSGLRLALIAIVSVAMSIAALAIKGRDDGVVRTMAYLIFAGETLYVSFATIDSMLDTWGFFLISGLLVAVLAFAASRVEAFLAASRAINRENVDAP